MNNVIIASVCAWALTQFIKVLIGLIRKRQIDLRDFVSSGGMPSSHSATVSALTTSVAIIEGIGSVAFGISVILAVIVMYDAAGVRQSVGRQSVVLNRIIAELRDRRPIAELEHNLRVFIGHTPFQVIVGSAMGIIVAWLWFTFVAR
ncbi:MAG: divergent PAP2 family protein [Dehalococcoidia bacterium]|nr:divergent PAP2 family protein [Dehalococcoidia bacterium]